MIKFYDVENTPWLNARQDFFLLVMEIRDILADNLKATRKRKGMSQEELAHQAEIDRTYISALERCVYGATIDVVDRLAKVLGVTAAQLLTARGQTEEKPRPGKPDGA